MNYFLSKSPFLAAAFVATLAAAAPVSAHPSGNWVDGNFQSCFTACGGSPVVSGEYAANTQPHDARRQHYFVCRVKLNTANPARRQRPGFNISSNPNRCQISGFNSVLHYDCLCL